MPAVQARNLTIRAMRLGTIRPPVCSGPARPPATTRSLAAASAGADIVAMRTTRRRFLAAASATATGPAAPALALAQSKETEAAGFEDALRAKFAAGDVLDWRGGNVRLRRPIVIEVTSNMLGPGL